MDLLQQGIEKGYIKFDNDNIEDAKNITYIHQNKKYRYTDPEEKVRAKIFLELIIDYGYPAKRIDLEYTVPRRTPSDLADIVVFNDDALKEPLIVVECKKEDGITDAEFKQAIEQGFGNANSLKAHYLWVTSITASKKFNVKDFPSMEREKNTSAIPHFGQTELDKAEYYKGGVNEKGEKRKDIRTLKESELTRKLKQAHDALWAGGKRNPAEAFDELDKLIFCKIWGDEKAVRKKGQPYDFQIFTGEDPENLLKRIRTIYDKARKYDSDVFSDNIRLTAPELQTVVSYLAEVDLNNTDLDSKGRAFETFMGDFFRGDFGAYFTPRKIVEFIVNSLPITKEDLILDPACGSGGFLLYALDKLRKKSDSMVDEGYFEKGSEDHKRYWHNFAKNNLFGIEISQSISRTAKMNMIIHDDGHSNIISFDGLDSIDTMRDRNKNEGFKKDRFQYIITNPPFGSSVKYSEKKYVENYDLGVKEINWIDAKLKNKNIHDKRARDRQSSEILFIEQCFNFLEKDGILAMVIPDGILTNSSSQYVRDWIEEKFRILAIISLPQTAFQATGAGVKSSVMFLKKYDLETIAIKKEQKNKIQDDLYDKPDYGKTFESIEQEKKDTIKKGDSIIQQINEDFIKHIDSLRNQKSITKEVQKQLEKENTAKIKKHEKTDKYKDWKQQINNEYNEKINTLKEKLQDEYLEIIKKKTTDYSIFMAIAEDIGYDAAGRETGTNELLEISKQLSDFIKRVNKGEQLFS